MSENIKNIDLNRVKFFPIMMFAIVMGLSGLSIMFQKAKEILGLDIAVSETLVVIVTIVFAAILITYIFKIIKYFDAVKSEFSHPVRINFFAASAISFLLFSVIYRDINYDLSFYSFIIGTAMQTFFTFYTISFWINKNLEITHSNPAWFIPIVANVLIPVSGEGMVDNNILMYYFSIGIFFWIILTAIIINRIIFHHQLADKFMPTIFIFIAPPSVGFLAYVKMSSEFDFFASTLYNLALFFTFLIFFMYKNFTGLKFFISWWAFTFPLSAVSIASMLAYKMSQIVIYKYFAYFFMIVTTLVVVIVTIQTIKHMIKKEICIQE